MTLLLVFVGTLFTIFALWRMISPFIGGVDVGLRLEHLDEEIREIELLVARREVLLGSLRELEVDRETDKIAPEDYARFRARYEREAVAIMKRLDEIHGGKAWQARVDEELSARLGRAPRLGPAAEGDAPAPEESAEVAPEEAIALEDAPEVSAEPEAPNVTADGPHDNGADDDSQNAELVPYDGACSSCGEQLDPGDKFCAQCGHPVTPPEAVLKPPSEATP